MGSMVEFLRLDLFNDARGSWSKERGSWRLMHWLVDHNETSWSKLPLVDLLEENVSLLC